MRRSIPLTHDGRLRAVAVENADHWFVVVIDPALEDLDRMSFPSAERAESAMRAALRRNAAPQRRLGEAA